MKFCNDLSVSEIKFYFDISLNGYGDLVERRLKENLFLEQVLFLDYFVGIFFDF